MNPRKTHRLVYILCISCLGLAFYSLMVFTPLFSDDWNYYLIFGTQQRISSLSDVFVSQYHHYFLNNGRFIPHFFVQSFDGLWGKSLFNITNTFVFLLFILLLLRVQNKTQWYYLPIVLAIILLLIPGFNNVFLWMSGACNYLWVAVLLLVFCQLMERDSFKARSYPLLFLFGVVCGWTNEALIVGFVAGILCHFFVHWKELTSHRAILLCGLILGALFLTLAPGSVHRFLEGKTTSSVSGAVHQLFVSLLAMKNLRLLPILLLALFLLAVFKKLPAGYFSDNLIWVVAVGVSFLFVLSTGHHADHSRFGIELFSLILILRLLDHFSISRSLTVICSLFVVVFLMQTLYYSRLNYQEYQRCVAQIQNTETGIIETNEVECPHFFDRMIVRFKPSENSDYYYYNSGWIDRYFEKEHLVFLPHRFLEQTRRELGSFGEFDTKTDLPFYAKIEDSGMFSKAVFHLAPVKKTDIPFVLRPMARKMERYSAEQVETDRIGYVDLPEGRFLLVMKNHMIDNRVERISLQ